jgi:hypothetical protein
MTYILTMETTTETKVCHCGATTGLEFFCHVTGSRWVCREKVACRLRAKAKTETKLNSLLGAAMVKANVTGSVTISTATDSSDSYADYTGYVVTAESPDVEARAAKWLSAWVAKNTKSTYCYTGTIGKLNGKVFVIESRYSLGE